MIKGIWVSSQRQQFKLLNAPPDPTKPRKPSPLTQERIDLLNELNFQWVVRERAQQQGPSMAWSLLKTDHDSEREHLEAASASLANIRQSNVVNVDDNLPTRTEPEDPLEEALQRSEEI